MLSSQEKGKILFKDQDGVFKELASCELKEENADYGIDAMRYAIQGITEGEMSITLDISKEEIIKILKRYGLKRISRKRFKKLLMGYCIQKNDAEIIAEQFYNEKIPYTQLAVQQVIKTIIEAEVDEEC